MNLSSTPLENYRLNVGLCIVNPQGFVLVGERIDIAGAWQCPQGGVDAGEDIGVAAWRELAEETGITPEAADLVQVHPQWMSYNFPKRAYGQEALGRYLGQTQKWCLFGYDGPLPNATVQTEVEFKAFKWVDAAWLVKHVVAFRQEGYQQAFKDFGLI